MRTHEHGFVPDPSWKYGPPDPPGCPKCSEVLDDGTCPECGWEDEDVSQFDTLRERDDYDREA